MSRDYALGLPERLRPSGLPNIAWSVAENDLVIAPLSGYRKLAAFLGISTDRRHSPKFFLVTRADAIRLREAYVHPSTIKASELERRLNENRQSHIDSRVTDQQTDDHRGIVAMLGLIEERDRRVVDAHGVVIERLRAEVGRYREGLRAMRSRWGGIDLRRKAAITNLLSGRTWDGQIADESVLE